MIITGKWAYKKYKKRKSEKEKALAAESAHHDELVHGAHNPTCTPDVTINTSPIQQHIQPPPYSDVDQTLFSPVYNQPFAPHSLLQQSPAPLSPSPLLSPHQQQQLPIEIAVRGRWVWQADAPETSMPNFVSGITADTAQHPYPVRNHAAELEPERAPAELAFHGTRAPENDGEKMLMAQPQHGGKMPVELPVDMSSSDSDNEKVTIAELDTQELSPIQRRTNSPSKLEEAGRFSTSSQDFKGSNVDNTQG